MSLFIYNSITREKEEFRPLKPPFVGMYVCGPTVYGHAHLGHARSYLTFDIIYRYLVFKGYKVRYVQNITDVGHLVGDQDEGQDKIQKQAKTEKMEPVEIAYKYEVSYFEDMDRLNILRPSISSRATGHIIDMIEHIKLLIEKKYAYPTDEGNVYFSVNRFNNYGKLSGRKIEEAMEGVRIEKALDKKNPEDFALWKKADPDHLMQWASPWGNGYPGWHIECSTMGMKYLGDTIDIHGGGLENIFPHHECEMAQSEAISGKKFVRYFIHNNNLTVNGTKMGKSLGNFITIKDLFNRYHPMILRFYLLQGHYHSPIDLTDDALDAAKNGFERLRKSVFSLNKAVEVCKASLKIRPAEFEELNGLKEQFITAMDDDFNTPRAIAVIYDILKVANTEILKDKPEPAKLIALQKLIDDFLINILGFKLDIAGHQHQHEDDLIELILKIRSGLREEKNFKLSDEIRNSLDAMGITIKDSPTGTTYSR